MGKDEILKEAFFKVKNEFSEHLDAINANTNEIQTNYEQMTKIEMKLDKLNERLDEMQMVITTISKTLNIQFEKKEEKSYQIKKLTNKEKEIFMLIYSGFTTYEEIARKGGYTTNLIKAYIGNLIAKGVPIIKRYVGNTPQLTLNPKFKELQAKENITLINAEIGKKVRDNAL